MGNFLMFRDDIIFGKCAMRELHLGFTARTKSWVKKESIFDHIFPSDNGVGNDSASHIKQFVNDR